MSVMTTEGASLAPLEAFEVPELRRRARSLRLRTALFLIPAGILAALFLYAPLALMVDVSLTTGSSFLSSTGPIYAADNYALMLERYVPNLLITVQLAFFAMVVDLVFGFPFAYILVRRVRYRDVVRALMVFPMFGALYVAFGMRFLLLPNGAIGQILTALGIPDTVFLFSLPAVVFAMSIFTFPFMVMSIGTALSNLDPTLEEAAACLGARSWQTFWRVILPLTRAGVVAGMLLVFGWSIGTFAEPLLLGGLNEQRTLAWTLYQRGVVSTDYGVSATMGIVLLVVAFVVTYFSLRYSRGALVE
jgi:ABC-type spermidine/putrescine transport system permease subunit I